MTTKAIEGPKFEICTPEMYVCRKRGSREAGKQESVSQNSYLGLRFHLTNLEN